MRIGIIGLAGIGAQHLRIMSEGMAEFDVVAACDINEAVLGERTQGTGLAVFTDAQAMMDGVGLDAVSLCTPPKAHLPHTRLAAERGIHVLCEKPMAPTIADCRAMIGACQAAGVTLMIAQKKRFVRALGRLRELADGALGPIQVLYHRYPHPWMPETDWFWAEDDGGGPLLENAIHAADVVRFLLGDIERVYAEGDVFNARHRAPQLNCAVYTFRAKSGAMGMVGAGMIGAAPAMIFEDYYAACEDGIAQVSGGFDNPTHLQYAFRECPEELHEESFEGEDPFVDEFAHFAECVRNGTRPVTSGEESMRSIALALAVKASARRGRAVRPEELL